jgi:hypothetical protein
MKRNGIRWILVAVLGALCSFGAYGVAVAAPDKPLSGTIEATAPWPESTRHAPGEVSLRYIYFLYKPTDDAPDEKKDFRYQAQWADIHKGSARLMLQGTPQAFVNRLKKLEDQQEFKVLAAGFASSVNGVVTLDSGPVDPADEYQVRITDIITLTSKSGTTMLAQQKGRITFRAPEDTGTHGEGWNCHGDSDFGKTYTMGASQSDEWIRVYAYCIVR